MNLHHWRQQTGEWVEHTREIMGQILTRVGPRPSGSPESRQTAAMLAEAIGPYVDSVELERFRFSRRSFLSFLRWQAVSFTLAVTALFLGWIPVAAVVILTGAGVSVAQFVLYRELLDPLYSWSEGVNVVARVEPEGEVHRQVIISGHHDSAYVFRLIQHFPRIYPLFVLLANLFIWGAALLIPLWAVLELAGISPFYGPALPWILAGAGLLFVVPLWFFVSGRCTPGAGDNLVASAGAVTLARALAHARKCGQFRLQNTRVWFVSFDAEESGLRGSRAFVRRHLAELREHPAELLNVDSIYDLRDLHFIVRDVNGTIPLSERLARECVDLAASLGFHSRTLSMPLGSGATDAGEFGRFGITATTMIAMSTRFIPPRGFAYHTLRDTLEAVKPEAIAAMLEVLWAMLLRREPPVPGLAATPSVASAIPTPPAD